MRLVTTESEAALTAPLMRTRRLLAVTVLIATAPALMTAPVPRMTLAEPLPTMLRAPPPVVIWSLATMPVGPVASSRMVPPPADVVPMRESSTPPLLVVTPDERLPLVLPSVISPPLERSAALTVTVPSVTCASCVPPDPEPSLAKRLMLSLPAAAPWAEASMALPVAMVMLLAALRVSDRVVPTAMSTESGAFQVMLPASAAASSANVRISTSVPASSAVSIAVTLMLASPALADSKGLSEAGSTPPEATIVMFRGSSSHWPALESLRPRADTDAPRMSSESLLDVSISPPRFAPVAEACA